MKTKPTRAATERVPVGPSAFCGRSLRPSRSRTLALLLLGSLAVVGGDWPTYRGDNARGGATTETLAFPLREVWTRQSPQAPHPAWPAPARRSLWQRLERLEPRMADDRVFHPVATGDQVFYASSADDTVYCLNAGTGEMVWRFVTDAPVRYAPTIAGDRVLFGSDDGFVYCLNRIDGAVRWQQRVGPADRRLPGNGRLISVWPLRTSVLVQNGIVHCFAGLFPSEGVFSAAYKLEDGAIVYHERTEQSPQGYLLAAAGELYAPTGRGNPIAVDQRTGRVLRSYEGGGGTFALAVDDQLVAGPGNGDSLTVSQRTNRASLVQFSGRQMVVTATVSYLLSTNELLALDRPRYLGLAAQRRQHEARREDVRARLKKAGPTSDQAATLQAEIGTLTGKIKQFEQDLQGCYLWRVPGRDHEAMIVAGPHVILGGENHVSAWDAKTGVIAWEAAVSGTAYGLAAANGRLLVSTDTGELRCFAAPGTSDQPRRWPSAATSAPGHESPEEAPALSQIVRQVAQTPAARQGYALLLGSDNLALAKSLARHTSLSIALLSREQATVKRLRQHLADSALYGARISVHHVVADKLPFTEQCANLVIDENVLQPGRSPAWPERELKRVLRPFGSLAWWRGQPMPFVSPPLPGAGQWTHLYANPANTAATDDQHITRTLALQWFGGPGPRRMVDRHLRGPAPLAVNGRLFIAAENRLIGVDAFNGTELWDLELPHSQRYSIPYDAGYLAADEHSVYAAVADRLWTIDAATGEVRCRLEVPSRDEPAQRHWGYVAVAEGALFGSAQRPTAARHEPTWEAIDQAYWSRQPVVTSDYLFCLGRERNQPAWVHGAGPIVNPTITIADGRVYFFECRNEQMRRHPSGRIGLKELTASGFYLVALEAASGKKVWEKSMDLRNCENILYLSAARGFLVVVGSGVSPEDDAQYHVRVLDAATGADRWQATHDNGRPGALGHGEQVHHPVIVGDILVAEPAMYDLASGRPYNPEGKAGPWPIVRPGHSCGTMSGAGTCLFFRASNPTVLDIGRALPAAARFTKLAPSRPGCWINLIPANGLLLIPEASAGCVCGYSFEASMAFRSVGNP